MMKRFLRYLIFSAYLFLLFDEAKAQNQTITNGATTSPINFPANGCLYNWVNSNPGIGLPANGTGNIAAFSATNTTANQVTATITATPIASGYGYVANVISNDVSVISTATNTLVATIPVGSSPEGVTVSPNGSYAYVTNSNSNTVSVINTASNMVIATVPVGIDPLGVVVSPDGSHIYVTNANSNTVSVIDAATNMVSSTYTTGNQPLGVSISPDGGSLYVANGLSNTISVINTSSGLITATINVGSDPLTSAVSPDGTLLYVSNQLAQNVSVINTITNMVIATIPIGLTPAALVFSPNGNTVYVADPSIQKVYVINTATNAVTSTISIPTSPQGISISPNGSELYVTDRGNQVWVINTTTNAVINKITVGSYPVSLGNFITPNLVCNGTPITFTIKVNPSPVITTGAVSGSISACAGSASASPNIQQFTVSGSNLSTGIIATAPVGFEISTIANSGYSGTVTLAQTGGIVDNTVYVRSAASASAGIISGNVKLISGSASQSISVSGVVTAIPVANTVGNQSVISGSIVAATNLTGTAASFTWVNNTPGIGLAANGKGNIPSFTAVNNSNVPIVATITVTPLGPPLAYITNYHFSQVTVINTATNAVQAIVPTTIGGDPFYVAISPDGSKAYIAGDYLDVSVINTATNTAITSFGSETQGIVVSPDGSKLYVTNTGLDLVTVYNTATNTIIGNITLPSGSGAQGVAISPDGTLLYVTSELSNNVSVINTITNTVIGTVTVGSEPWNIAISPDGTRLYVTNISSNNVSVINTATNSVVSTIAVGSDPEGVTVSPDGTMVYVANGGSNTVSVISTATNTIVATINTGVNPWGVDTTPDGKYVYVTNQLSDNVSVISTTTNSVVNTIQLPIGTYPTSLGKFISVGSSTCATPITFNITVNPSPIIAAGMVTGIISACVGSASSSPNIQQFTVSGNTLTTDIVATAPAGFEISLTANSGFGNTLTLTQTGGTVNATVVYVRSAASDPAGNISGTVTLVSGTATQNVTVAGLVNAIPTVNMVGNQSVANGSPTAAVNFAGTANTFNWVNNTPGIGLAASGTGDIASFTAINTGPVPVTATITVTPVPAPAYAYIANSIGTVSVINVSTMAVIANISLGFASQPFAVAVSPDGTRVYVTDEGNRQIWVIDTKTNKIITGIDVPTPPTSTLIAIAVSPDGSRLYVTDGLSNNIYVINSATYTTVATIVTAANPGGVCVSPDGNWIYVANQGANSVSVINAKTNTLLTNITNVSSARAITISHDGTRLYVANAAYTSVTVIDTKLNSIIANIPSGQAPSGIAISPDDKTLYVVNQSVGTVTVINTQTLAIIATIPLLNAQAPIGISITSDGSEVYVTGQEGNVYVISTATNTVINTIKTDLGSISFGNFITPGGGTCSGSTRSFTITVNSTPAITTSGNLTATNTIYGTPSASVNFTISATNLTAGILVTPPPGFEVSIDNITFTNTITVGGTGNIVAVPVYIRLASTTNAGNYSGNIQLSSAGVANVSVPVPLSVVNPAPLSIQAADVNKNYGTPITGNTNSSAFTITAGSLQNGDLISTVIATHGTGSAATDPVGIYPSVFPTIGTTNNFLISNYNITYVPGNIIVLPAPLTITANNVHKPFGATLTGAPTSTAFTSAGLQNQETIGTVAIVYGVGSAATDPIGLYANSVAPSTPAGGTFSIGNYTISYIDGDIMVDPIAAISTSGVLSAVNTIYGQPSPSTNFAVSGTVLSAAILVTPPNGFEISTDNLKFYSTVTVGTAGNIASSPVYIRLASTTPAGSYAGSISLSSGITTGTNLMIPASIVAPAPLTIAADNMSRAFGTTNPLLTATYTGFVNNEHPAQLTAQPVISSTAVTLSPAGQYVISVGGAKASNYVITYVQGILTIYPAVSSIVIPNAFTPNNDGTNDLWDIPGLASFDKCSVKVYNRYGQLVFYSVGYGNAWDGTYKGAPLAVGVYYYIIQPGNNLTTLSGWVTIIR